ncbi:HNH endonuclease signature motif containing protein [Antarcticirhabdus aurantiaca]|uniref:HNH endonuclease signature motif containing protein n=1 Tax=Antarcticirhabdus aurantiaca TaxID=2606717 RepID=A0ACD4NRN5_9HYPH|nr:HNH endonuclease signature motif containing protein [Jeongeuplla avenae]
MARLRDLPPVLGRVPPRITAPPKIAESFYLSVEWRSLMSRLKAERGSRCQDCGKGGRIIGDHVVELKDGGAPLDPGNIRLVCIPCHNRKTAKAKARRARGG